MPSYELCAHFFFFKHSNAIALIHRVISARMYNAKLITHKSINTYQNFPTEVI